MKKYTRVSYEVRCQIFAFLQAGFSVPQIAEALSFNKSTIYREIKRNSKSVYDPRHAQKLTVRRAKRRIRKSKLKGKLLHKVTRLLKSGLSPEQISGRLKLEGKEAISHTSIYRLAHKDRELKRTLRWVGKRGFSRYRKLKIKSRHGKPISERPFIINSRSRKGDWERDGMYGANKRQLLVCTERKSKFTLLELMPSPNSKLVSELTIKMLKRSKGPVYSITNDRGTEFRGEQEMNIPVYYCDPLKPQQRGTVENTIGMLRRKITRKTDLVALGAKEIRKLEKEFNLTPRKCLGFRTPFEVFYKTKVALVM